MWPPLLPLSCLIYVVLQAPLSRAETALPPVQQNANHIFNAIHSSMRQWGSSLNHNGMSFFLATVPKGTLLYHGTGVSERVNGTEWLAFEPEHSMIFARPGHGPGGPPGGPGRGRRPGNPNGAPPGPPGLADPDRRAERFPTPVSGHTQEPLEQHDPKWWKEIPVKIDDEINAGFLHTYAARSDLRLLYIDGESAAKSEKGTLDTQDYVLLNDTSDHSGFWEYERAKGMCEASQKHWSGQIDGFLRMEGGFEIILCSFADNLDTVRITRTRENGGRGGPMGGGDDHFSYYRAITARYHGIGGGRVILNYDDFVTAYSYPIDLFNGTRLPRLENISAEAVSTIKTDIGKLVLSDADPRKSINWQSVVDQIITRYATRLKYLVSGAFDTSKLLNEEIDRILRPYIDYEFRNSALEVERCATQFLPASFSSSIASEAVYHVTQTLCSTLSRATEMDFEEALSSIQDLIEYLAWTVWKDCGTCALDEICFVPIWPIGNAEDFESPSCTNATGMQSKRGYWGGFGPRPPHRPGEGEPPL